MQTSCIKSVHKLLTGLVRTACYKVLEWFWTSRQQLVTRILGISDLLQASSNKTDTVMISAVEQEEGGGGGGWATFNKW